MAKNNKIVKFRKISHFNIGIVVFIVIFIYMMYNTYQYVTAKQVAVYEVSLGTIAQNNTYTGVILREETIYNTDKSGYINYFNRDATKVGVSSYVYSIDETGDFYRQIRQQNEQQLFLEEDSFDELEKIASNYVNSYYDKDFYQVYMFTHEIEAELMEIASMNALSGLSNYSGNMSSLHTYQATEPGIVVYNTDGLENITLDNFSKDIFDEASYEKNNLISREQVTAGEAAYKLITSELWTLLVPIDQELASALSDTDNLQILFKKDNSTAWGASNIINKDNEWYLVLTFQNSAIRFATDRFLEIDLMLADVSGLKVPLTALTEKEFFLIPKEYLTKGGESSSNGVMRQYTDKDGKTVMEFSSVVIAEETEDSYYIAGDSIQKGDIIIKPDSNEKYTLGETASLQGVYNINRGYAVFRKVEILFQNQEYAILDTDTNYGISLYDYIVLDASAISENEIINQ